MISSVIRCRTSWRSWLFVLQLVKLVVSLPSHHDDWKKGFGNEPKEDHKIILFFDKRKFSVDALFFFTVFKGDFCSCAWHIGCKTDFCCLQFFLYSFQMGRWKTVLLQQEFESSEMKRKWKLLKLTFKQVVETYNKTILQFVIKKKLNLQYKVEIIKLLTEFRIGWWRPGPVEVSNRRNCFAMRAKWWINCTGLYSWVLAVEIHCFISLYFVRNYCNNCNLKFAKNSRLPRDELPIGNKQLGKNKQDHKRPKWFFSWFHNALYCNKQHFIEI